jgi:hypothetical protein
MLQQEAGIQAVGAGGKAAEGHCLNISVSSLA